MRQVLQSYGNGELWLADVPAPAVRDHEVLVATAASVVSAGTEKMIVDLAKKSLVGKAAARPDLVRKILSKIGTEGLQATLQKVSSKLNDPIVLGYSCAGTVAEVGAKVRGVEVGDVVACGGAGYATHAEFNAVPANLCARIPAGVTMDDAAFTTIGAIALQGIRQADVRLGERVAVIGLGLIGLLTVQMLKAGGCKVLGSDPDEDRCRLARALGADMAVSTHFSGTVTAFTEGLGADAVIIAAATPSNEPVELAAQIARMKGRVVVVGLVGMDIPREAYYRKELDLRLSMSYGPGRYDPEYEEGGRDYPFAYVRWTEQRNMRAFLELVAEGKVTPSKLVTHRFPIERGLEAYATLEDKESHCLGVILEYPLAKAAPIPKRGILLNASQDTGVFGVGVIGAGSFAKGVLIPALKRRADVRLAGLCTATGRSAERAGRAYGFGVAVTDPARLFDDVGVGAVFIATRHDSHARLTCDALKAGKHVFVEKPLALNPEQLAKVAETYRSLVARSGDTARGTRSGAVSAPVLMVGFNRRFSPHARAVREAFADRSTPMMVSYRVNAGNIPRDSWVQDLEQGGGRIVGEVCHFVDLCSFLTGSVPVRVSAACISTDRADLAAEDTVAITIQHRDGSLSSIQYVAVGGTRLPKERIEVFAGDGAAVIDNFARTQFHGIRGRSVRGRQDKGFDGELDAFFRAVRGGGVLPIDFEELLAVTRATYAIRDSLRTGRAVDPG